MLIGWMGFGRGKTAPQVSPVALEVVHRIVVLFDIERGINGKSAGERLSMRQELSTLVLSDLNKLDAGRAGLAVASFLRGEGHGA